MTKDDSALAILPELCAVVLCRCSAQVFVFVSLDLVISRDGVAKLTFSTNDKQQDDEAAPKLHAVLRHVTYG